MGLEVLSLFFVKIS